MTKRAIIKPTDWWTDNWDLVRWCTPVGSGCKFCWTRDMMNRFDHLGDFNEVRTLGRNLGKPIRARKPRIYATSLLGDIFHAKVPPDFTLSMVKVISGAPKQHFFVLLTKRWGTAAHHMINLFKMGHRSDRVILMGSAWDDQSAQEASSQLRKVEQVGLRWGLHIEPCLGRIDPSKWEMGDDGSRERVPAPDRARHHHDGQKGPILDRMGVAKDDSWAAGEAGSGAQEASGHRPVTSRRISEDPASVGREAPGGGGSSDRVDDCQPQRHSERDGDQSRERKQTRQSSGQSGDNDQIWQHATRDPRAQSETWKSTGHEEQLREADRGGCETNTVVDRDAQPPTASRAIRGGGDHHLRRREAPHVGPYWVVVGGENNRTHARPMDPAWAMELLHWCDQRGVAFWFKGWGNTGRWCPGCKSFLQDPSPHLGKTCGTCGTCHTRVEYRRYKKNTGHVLSAGHLNDDPEKPIVPLTCLERPWEQDNWDFEAIGL